MLSIFLPQRRYKLRFSRANGVCGFLHRRWLQEGVARENWGGLVWVRHPRLAAADGERKTENCFRSVFLNCPKAYAYVAKHIGLPLKLFKSLNKVNIGLKHSKPRVRVLLYFQAAQRGPGPFGPLPRGAPSPAPPLIWTGGEQSRVKVHQLSTDHKNRPCHQV